MRPLSNIVFSGPRYCMPSGATSVMRLGRPGPVISSSMRTKTARWRAPYDSNRFVTSASSSSPKLAVVSSPAPPANATVGSGPPGSPPASSALPPLLERVAGRRVRFVVTTFSWLTSALCHRGDGVVLEVAAGAEEGLGVCGPAARTAGAPQR